jgi:hypothetical protein
MGKQECACAVETRKTPSKKLGSFRRDSFDRKGLLYITQSRTEATNCGTSSRENGD